jgi:hypothetical protein
VHVRRQVRIIDGELVFSLPKGGKQWSVPLSESVGLRLSMHIAEHGTAEVTLHAERPGSQTRGITASTFCVTPRHQHGWRPV